MNTVPDRCPFCESPIMVHGGNLLRSSDGGFASYECKTVQDIELSDDEWKRAGQSEPCRKREVQLLTKQRDEARERIKRLEEALEGTVKWIVDLADSGDAGFWNPDEQSVIIAARAALEAKEAKL